MPSPCLAPYLSPAKGPTRDPSCSHKQLTWLSHRFCAAVASATAMTRVRRWQRTGSRAAACTRFCVGARGPARVCVGSLGKRT